MMDIPPGLGALTYAMFSLSKCTEFLNNLPVDLSRNVTKCDDLISTITLVNKVRNLKLSETRFKKMQQKLVNQ
jgi:hypothetical protein